MALACVRVKSPEGALYWHKYIRIMNELVNDQNEAVLEVPILTIIKQHDSFLRVK